MRSELIMSCVCLLCTNLYVIGMEEISNTVSLPDCTVTSLSSNYNYLSKLHGILRKLAYDMKYSQCSIDVRDLERLVLENSSQLPSVKLSRESGNCFAPPECSGFRGIVNCDEHNY
jgi:hypothetical protein